MKYRAYLVLLGILLMMCGRPSAVAPVATPSFTPEPTPTGIASTATVQPTAPARSWYLDAINAPVTLPPFPKPATIAIIDTGIDRTHPALQGRVITRIAIVDADVVDAQGHGSHTAGIIVADDVVSPGICPLCSLIDVQAISVYGYGSDSTVAAGITAAVDAGAQVINLSVGGSGDSQVMQQAIAYALDHDVVVVAAAGNQNEYITYPAAYPGVLAVSALTPHLRRAEFAHGGDIVAPGVDIRNVAAGGSGMRSDEGTSTAAPQVSAAAGIIRSLRPDFNALQTRELILSTTQDLGAPGFDDEFGYGMLDIAQILRTLNDPDVTNRGGIRGHIDGIDAQRVSIELVDYQLIAPDASGNFAITGLPAGNYMLQIIGNDSALIATPLPVTVSGIGLTPINISIVVDAPYATITQPVP